MLDFSYLLELILDLRRQAKSHSHTRMIPQRCRWSLPAECGDGRYTIGWQRWTEKRGGPSFVTLRRNAFGTLKIVQRYPLTDAGWADAWRALIKLDPDSAEKVRTVLDRRAAAERAVLELSRLDANSLCCLPEVIFLGGYAAEADLAVGACYDLRFFEDRLTGCRRTPRPPFTASR